MALVIPPGFAQCSVEIRNSGDPNPWYVTYGLDVSGVGGDFEEAAFAAGSAWTSTVGLQLATTSTFIQARLSVGQDGGPPLTVIAPLVGAGTSTAPMLPQNCAALYDKGTALAGRRGRGRMFVPNILKETTVSDVGVMTPASRTDLQVQATAFLNELNNGDPFPATPMVLLHNEGPGVPPPTPVTSFTVQAVISTQRRRLR
uniref:Uncharacterized protein n=1 Tax=uncultured prokaryote TaxID=198431 RepID=A0A0H5Q3Q5_9ZZZZ|nr:hypothetical protein [uncultured prokaryote]